MPCGNWDPLPGMLVAMRLKDAANLDQAVATLEAMERTLSGLQSAGNLDELMQRYFLWVDGSWTQLDNLFADSALADQLWSRHLELRNVNRSQPRPFDPVIHEITYQRSVLTGVIEQLRKDQVFRDVPGDLVVLDTSALMQGVWLTDFDWRKELSIGAAARLIIPIIVLEELDVLKDTGGNNKAGDRARRVIRQIREIFQGANYAERAAVPNRAEVTLEVLLDDDWHTRRPIADAEIVDQALGLKDSTGKLVTLVCIDASMEFRARRLGLNVHVMPYPPAQAPPESSGT